MVALTTTTAKHAAIAIPSCGGNETSAEFTRIEPNHKCTSILSERRSSLDESCASPKKIPRSVSFDEENNENFEIPRINERFKTKCWLTKEELQHNMMMNRVRGLVEAKLEKLIAKNHDFFETTRDTDDTETETEGDTDDDLLEGLGENHNSTKGQEPKEEHNDSFAQRGVVPARKDRILQHLVDAIMERRKEDIHSFLTSKCSISFSRQPKKKK